MGLWIYDGIMMPALVCLSVILTSGMASCMNANIVTVLVNVSLMVVVCSGIVIFGWIALLFCAVNWMMEYIFQMKKEIMVLFFLLVNKLQYKISL